MLARKASTSAAFTVRTDMTSDCVTWRHPETDRPTYADSSALLLESSQASRTVSAQRTMLPST